jgi:Zn-finger nucleic acid-binding protein
MCPVCAKPTVAFELEGVEIDRCLDCGGTWLDSGELELLAGPKRGKLGEAMFAAKGGKHGGRTCFRCTATMRLVKVDSVELDRCPRGHGLWLDKGEMERLIAAFSEGEEGAVARLLGDLTAAERKKGGGA